ncbi:MAG: bifunctional metallophosphatase/5'-nucleotidase [Oscillospiraceae bacterium]|jgi:5'-nucleotidase|nr:bifunctional metallophosphatase/5'-nucleotidase [Oscillospiraceae bacterium]
MKKKLLNLLFVLALLGVLIVPVSAAETPEVVIFHTGDVHGFFAAEDGVIGHDVIAAELELSKAETPASFLVDTGDATQGNFFVNSNLGEAAIDIMNAAGYDAMALGNHDLDFEWSRVLDFAALADFPLLTQSSVIDSDTAIEPGVIIERGGYKVGFFGITTPETKQISNGGFDRSFGTLDELIEYSTQTAANLRAQGAELVICLSHMGVFPASGDASFGTSYDLSSGAEGIDLIIDGHSHTPLDEIINKDGEIPIASAGSNGEFLGVVEFYDEGGVLKPRAYSLTKDSLAGTAPDASVTAVIDKWLQAEEAAGGEIVANNPVALEHDETTVRTRETPIGNLIADALRESAGAEVALLNGGNINAPLPEGAVTRGQINDILPYSNQMLLAAVTGSVLREALEHSVSVYPQAQGGFMQVSGLKFIFDPAKPAGERILYIEVGGKRLEDTREYTLTTNDFIASGGDGYTMLTGPFESAQIVGTDMAGILASYISAHPEGLDMEIEGRIVMDDKVPGSDNVIIIGIYVVGGLSLAALIWIFIKKKSVK